MTLAVNLANLVDALGTDGTITDAKSVSDKPNTSTGYFDLPSGTTGQRPASPTTGMVRHNSSLGLIETWNGTTWTGLGGSATISGTAPASPTDGAFWLNSETGDLYTYGPGGWILAGGFGGSYNDLTNKPSLSTVATTGSYADLINKPAITPSAVSDQANTSTGYFGMPTGTTAQRPVSPANGFTRINTTTNYLEVYYNANWVNMQYIGLISAVYSGATLSYAGNYILLTYTGTTGSFTPTVVPVGATVDYVIVGGGGAGGVDQGGGGGAGGYLTGTFSVAQQAYPITIGLGGTCLTTNTFVNGSSSTAFGLTAVGGGGGAGISYSTKQGATGGSGGGGSSNWITGSGTANIGGLATTGQGYAGGAGDSRGTSTSSSGGGGGGAGGVGASVGANVQPGIGGVGIANPFAGSTAGQLVNGTYYLAGGGGGGTYQGTRAAGGSGGGGSGAGPGSTWDGTSGTANTGGGGGGQSGLSGVAAGNGGSGIVIIRYRYQ